jgi:hypothetical protein
MMVLVQTRFMVLLLCGERVQVDLIGAMDWLDRTWIVSGYVTSFAFSIGQIS